MKAPGGKSQTITQAVTQRSLKLTSEYNLGKVSEEAPASAASGSKDTKEPADDDKKVPKWLLGDSEPADVHVETKWQSLISDEDNLTKIMYLRGRICIENINTYKNNK